MTGIIYFYIHFISTEISDRNFFGFFLGLVSNNTSMSCIRFKFKSSLDYEKVTFDGLQISVADLRQKIMQQKKLGLSDDFTLQIMDAQSKKGELKFCIIMYIYYSFSCYYVYLLQLHVNCVQLLHEFTCTTILMCTAGLYILCIQYRWCPVHVIVCSLCTYIVAYMYRYIHMYVPKEHTCIYTCMYLRTYIYMYMYLRNIHVHIHVCT